MRKTSLSVVDDREEREKKTTLIAAFTGKSRRNTDQDEGRRQRRRDRKKRLVSAISVGLKCETRSICFLYNRFLYWKPFRSHSVQIVRFTHQNESKFWLDITL